MECHYFLFLVHFILSLVKIALFILKLLPEIYCGFVLKKISCKSIFFVNKTIKFDKEDILYAQILRRIDLRLMHITVKVKGKNPQVMVQVCLLCLCFSIVSATIVNTPIETDRSAHAKWNIFLCVWISFTIHIVCVILVLFVRICLSYVHLYGLMIVTRSKVNIHSKKASLLIKRVVKKKTVFLLLLYKLHTI